MIDEIFRYLCCLFCKKKREEIKPLQKQKLKLFIKKKFKNIDGST